MRLVDIESESFLNEMREKQNACKEMIQSSDGATPTWTERDHWEGVYGTFVEIALTLKKQPAVDAVPVVHGKWFDAMVCELPVQVCDQCSTFFPLAYTGGGHHYCPNCGAKMDLEETKDNGTDNP